MGSAPVAVTLVAGGLPAVVTVNAPAAPTVNVVVLALVISTSRLARYTPTTATPVLLPTPVTTAV